MGLFSGIKKLFGIQDRSTVAKRLGTSVSESVSAKVAQRVGTSGTREQRTLEQRGPGQREAEPQVPRTERERFLAGEWVSVVSSNLDRIAWVAGLNGGTLKVIFKDQNEYAVWPISLGEAEGIYDAGSKGKWYWSNVRIRGTALGHKKSYAHVAHGGTVRRKWVDAGLESIIEHANEVDLQSQEHNLYANKGPFARMALPESVPVDMFTD